MNTCPKCGLVKGLHGSVLPGCTCWDAYPQHAETTPPQRPWVGLTEQEQGAIMEDLNAHGTRLYLFARAIERKLKEKNDR